MVELIFFPGVLTLFTFEKQSRGFIGRTSLHLEKKGQIVAAIGAVGLGLSHALLFVFLQNGLQVLFFLRELVSNAERVCLQRKKVVALLAAELVFRLICGHELVLRLKSNRIRRWRCLKVVFDLDSIDWKGCFPFIVCFCKESARVYWLPDWKEKKSRCSFCRSVAASSRK